MLVVLLTMLVVPCANSVGGGKKKGGQVGGDDKGKGGGGGGGGKKTASGIGGGGGGKAKAMEAEGFAAMEKGNFELCIQKFKKATQLDPEFADYHTQVGSADAVCRSSSCGHAQCTPPTPGLFVSPGCHSCIDAALMHTPVYMGQGWELIYVPAFIFLYRSWRLACARWAGGRKPLPSLRQRGSTWNTRGTRWAETRTGPRFTSIWATCMPREGDKVQAWKRLWRYSERWRGRLPCSPSFRFVRLAHYTLHHTLHLGTCVPPAIINFFLLWVCPSLQATEFAPQLADAYSYLGNALSEVGNFNEARKAYQSSVRATGSTQPLPDPARTMKQKQQSGWGVQSTLECPIQA